MKQKYIIYKNGDIQIFGLGAIHSFVAGGREVQSAGFVELDENNKAVEVYGESTTLGVKSRPQDLELINSF